MGLHDRQRRNGAQSHLVDHIGIQRGVARRSRTDERQTKVQTKRTSDILMRIGRHLYG